MTAVEWLLEEINKLTGLNVAIDEPIVEQALEMEKQQIFDAYKNGVEGTKFAEDYYNETFKNKYNGTNF